MVTGATDVDIAVRAIREGASDYVTKPLNLDEVQIVVTDPKDAEHPITLTPVQDKPGRYTGSFSPDKACSPIHPRPRLARVMPS